VADREVEALVRQRHQPVRHIELDAGARVGLQKGLDVRCDVLAPERHRGRDAHQAARCGRQVAHLADAAGDLREGLCGLIDELLAGVGEPQRARRALHQGLVDAAFELGDALAHRRLRQAQPLCHLGEAAELREQGQRVHLGPEQVGALCRSEHARLFSSSNSQVNRRSLP
jgi:hypothetical protein